MAQKADFRKTVFDLLPHLEILDGSDKAGNEVLEESDDEDLEEEEDDEDEGDFVIGKEEDEEDLSEEEGIATGGKRSAPQGLPAEGEEEGELAGSSSGDDEEGNDEGIVP